LDFRTLRRPYGGFVVYFYFGGLRRFRLAVFGCLVHRLGFLIVKEAFFLSFLPFINGGEGLKFPAVGLCSFIFRFLLLISFLHAFFLKKGR
jgi:hypothetical protein